MGDGGRRSKADHRPGEGWQAKREDVSHCKKILLIMVFILLETRKYYMMYLNPTFTSNVGQLAAFELFKRIQYLTYPILCKNKLDN